MLVICGSTHCGHELGRVDISPLGRDPRPVWYITPGWHWRQGVLEFGDETFRSERQLSHEVVGRQRAPEGMALVRQAYLPICVRCPNCHRARWIPPDILIRPVVPARPATVVA